jgi:8-oxo-dGTP pyrophosphatase MutT (NUDIX family)
MDIEQGPRPFSEPVLAATILLLRDDPLEVLMVRRSKGSHFSSALVFPGGVVDPEDSSQLWIAHVAGADALPAHERALRIAACREAFEEAFVFVGEGAPGDREGDFLERVRDAGASLALDRLHRFAHWITPKMARKRFDTHFYLCAAPADAAPQCDGSETVAMEWVRPHEALERAERGEQSFLFPTLMNLKRLSESESVASAIAAAQARPIFTVTPRVERREQGDVIVIPEEAGYGVTEHAAPAVAGPPE